ncbi:MAG: Snf7 family protein [Nitrososphaeraceae archaeon]|jgi:division protein CdvB (Snf7/Vps24/ESCRT-III family)
MQFKSKWINPEPLLEDESKYDSSIKHRIPLKPRVDAVLKRIDFQISKLEIIANDLKSNDYEIFRNAMSLVKENNSERARVYLSDLMQIRKISKTVVLSKIVFENLKIQLNTISSIVDLVSLLSPTIAVVKNIRSSLIPYIPESEGEVGEISELLGGILIDAGQVGSYVINFEAANEKALHIINEVLIFVEQKIKQEFPILTALESISSQRDDMDIHYNQHTQYK